MIKYILFDLDGTLTNPKEGITKCVQHALRHFGIEEDSDNLTSFIGPPLKEQFKKFASLNEEQAEEAVRVYRERYAPIGVFENGVYDGIIPMLASLKKQGKILALATSKPTVFAKQIVEKYEMNSYLDFLSGSELDGTNVDKASVIKIAMERLGASKENTIMVGDRKHDFIGAQENGIPCIGVSYGFADKGELNACDFYKIADSVKSLCEILLSI